MRRKNGRFYRIIVAAKGCLLSVENVRFAWEVLVCEIQTLGEKKKGEMMFRERGP